MAFDYRIFVTELTPEDIFSTEESKPMSREDFILYLKNKEQKENERR